MYNIEFVNSQKIASNGKPSESSKIIKVALMGPPNVGKSALFYQLTGKYVNICNYPGTTVDITYKDIPSKNKDYTIRIIDTPGLNSIFDTSDDAFVAIRVALEADYILFVGDAKNLKKILNLISGFKYLNKPFALVLNMWDEAKNVGIKINTDKLNSKLHSIDIFYTIAIQGYGISSVKNFLINLIVNELQKQNSHLFLKLILSSGNISQADFACYFSQFLNTPVQPDKTFFLNFLRQSSNDVETIYKESVSSLRPLDGKDRNAFDKISTHPIYGFLLAVIVLFVVYEFVGVFGAGTLVDLIEDGLFGKMINPFLKKTVEEFLGNNIVTQAFTGKYGIFTMGFTYAFALILPIMLTFFLMFSILEDIGYFPRLTILMNKFLMPLGLKGRATLPLVLGFGCDTMATLTTRILPTKKERILTTFILSLSIPCSAQLGVSLGILSKIGIYALGLWIVILIVATLVPLFLLNKLTFRKSSPTPFIIDIPPFRRPYISNILMKTFLKIMWYFKEAVPLFIFGTFILYLADITGLLLFIEKIFGPIIHRLLYMPPEIITIFILGFLRRDYGAAGLFAMFETGLITRFQAFTGVVIITLFVPCFAQFLVTLKEFGYKVAFTILFFNFFYAIFIGAILLRIGR
ncbi:MAG: FeoB small GTPase domain-containing protein [Planctomycetota bacterium]